MPDEVYTALQLAHIIVFGLLLFNKEWRVTAGFLVLSAILYYTTSEHMLGLGVEMYLARAFIDVCFGLVIFLSPNAIRGIGVSLQWLGLKNACSGWLRLSKFTGRGGTVIQPLILFVFTLYHLAAYVAINTGLFSFFSLVSLFGSPKISLYIWITNALNVAQIVVALGIIGDMVVRFAAGVVDAITYAGRRGHAGHAFVERTKGHQER